MRPTARHTKLEPDSYETEEVVMSTTVQLATRRDCGAPIYNKQHDLSVPGRRVIQNRVDIGPRAPFVRQKHPGEEVIYVLEVSLEYHVDGQPPATPARLCSSRPRRSTRCGTSAAATRPSSPPTSSRRTSRSSLSSTTEWQP